MKKTIIITIILSLLALCFGMTAAMVLNKTLKPKLNIIQDPPRIEEDLDKTVPPQTKNVLVIGTDKSGELADVIIIARYNPNKNIVSLFSIPRDTRVLYNGQYLKINSLYKDGVSPLKNKVENITGIRTNNYVVFSTNSFKEVIDILGGVDFDVPQNMKYSDPYQDLYINLQKGYQHLDGEKAEQLVRYRKYVMGDIDRIKVQQDFIQELINQKSNAGLLIKAPALIKEILSTVQTDLRISELSSYVSGLKDIENIQIKTFTLPGVADYIDGLSYWLQDETQTREITQDFLSDLIEQPSEPPYIEETNVELPMQ